MKIKRIEFMEEITDVHNDNIDVLVENEDGYNYIIGVGTPQDLLEEMNQEKANFVRPGTPKIIVKKLTKEIVTEAIQAYAEDTGYWLKLHQFANSIDISIFNKLEAEHRKEWEGWEEEWDLFELEGLDRLFYYIQKYTGIPVENRVLFEPMIFIIFVSSLVYCVLKPEVCDFFLNFS